MMSDTSQKSHTAPLLTHGAGIGGLTATVGAILTMHNDPEIPRYISNVSDLQPLAVSAAMYFGSRAHLIQEKAAFTYKPVIAGLMLGAAFGVASVWTGIKVDTVLHEHNKIAVSAPDVSKP